tara:strand:+ start:1745 stop:2098 length:354 start_codon:yes stop_codon:yes gene_type:complete
MSQTRKVKRKSPKQYKAKSVTPHRRAKAEISSRSRLPFPQYIHPPGLSMTEARPSRRLHVKKQVNIVGKRAQLTKNYMQLPNKVASAAKRKPVTRKVYTQFKLPLDIQRKINKLINK